MSDAFRDHTETREPSKRRYYTRVGWRGQIYSDGEGYERCASEWHFPCQCCHRKDKAQLTGAVSEEEEETERERVAPMSVPYDAIATAMTRTEQNMMEMRAFEAHTEDQGETKTEQFVYVYNTEGK